MIVVDTNVVSELMRYRPNDVIVSWFARAEPARLHLTSIVLAELLHGIELEPPSRKRAMREHSLATLVDEHFGDRVLAFDTPAARAYATLRASRRRAGRPIGGFDAQIAAICLANDATLATRNVRDFAGCGIRVVNPWEPGPAH